LDPPVHTHVTGKLHGSFGLAESDYRVRFVLLVCENNVALQEGTEWNSTNLLHIPQGLGRMSSPADYCRYAAECIALSERVCNPLDKVRLSDMGQEFLKLANKRERRETDQSDD